MFAVKLYHIWRKKFRPISPQLLKPTLPVAKCLNEKRNPLKEFERIGIILSGGGAKGSYQAGAMKAVYEFLERYDAHNKVKMIAGTSIGSWNALFWLANLVAGADEKPCALQQWWSNVTVGDIVQPVLYFPFYRNFVLSSEPWYDNFNAIFNNGAVKERLEAHITQPDAEGNLHFFFTHTNVEQARLEYTTNYGGLRHSSTGYRSFELDEQKFHFVENIEQLGRGVFSSMDLPLTFEYMKVPKQDNTDGYDYFEDGGVIDNLPIRFGTEVEGCDLLFVLPLNASFEKTVDQSSLVKRLFRVMDIRQGALEQNSFRLVGLYNELVRLRGVEEDYEHAVKQIYHNLLRGNKDAPETTASLELLETILPPGKTYLPSGMSDSASPQSQPPSQQRRKEVRVFAICPGSDLLIRTAEFWKKKEAEQAFDLMYKVTQEQLANHFTEFITEHHGCMLEVDSKERITIKKVF
jgi:predicted acylesterase/phospholipase RssA